MATENPKSTIQNKEVIVLSGVRGVGKTLIAKKAQKKIKFEIIEFFEEMAKLAKMRKELWEENVKELVNRERNYSKFAAEHLKIPIKIIENEKLNESLRNFVKAIK